MPARLDSRILNRVSMLKWQWEYSNKDGHSPVGQGELLTGSRPGRDGFYHVKSISGQVNGVEINRLLRPGTGIPGNVDPVTGTSYLGDNKIRPMTNDGSKPQLSSKGIVFSLKDDTYSNLFFGTWPPSPSYYEFHTAPPYPAGLVPPNRESFINFSAWSGDIASVDLFANAALV